MDSMSPSDMAAILGVLSGVVILLDIPPLVWHAKQRNLAPAALVSWFIILNLMTVTNAIIWPTLHPEQNFSGRGLCDIQAKLIVGSWNGIPAALAVILRSLARVMDPDNAVPSLCSAEKRRALMIEGSFCIVVPLVLMALHFIVQEVRFYVDPVTGCNPATDDSWPSIVLVYIWPALLAMGAGYYAAMLIFRLHKYRQQFSEILSAHNTTRARFNRLWQIGLLCLFWVLPQSIYQAAKSCTIAQFHEFDFAKLHDPAKWDVIIYNYGQVDISFDRWIRIIGGVLLFLFFGMGQDAVTMYKSWLKKMGLLGLFPKLARQRRESQETLVSSTSSKASTAWRKTKDMFGKRHKEVSSDSDITLVSLASSITEASPEKTMATSHETILIPAHEMQLPSQAKTANKQVSYQDV